MLVRQRIGKAGTREKLEISSIEISSWTKGIGIEKVGFDYGFLSS